MANVDNLGSVIDNTKKLQEQLHHLRQDLSKLVYGLAQLDDKVSATAAFESTTADAHNWQKNVDLFLQAYRENETHIRSMTGPPGLGNPVANGAQLQKPSS